MANYLCYEFDKRLNICLKHCVLRVFYVWGKYGHKHKFKKQTQHFGLCWLFLMFDTFFSFVFILFSVEPGFIQIDWHEYAFEFVISRISFIPIPSLNWIQHARINSNREKSDPNEANIANKSTRGEKKKKVIANCTYIKMPVCGWCKAFPYSYSKCKINGTERKCIYIHSVWIRLERKRNRKYYIKGISILAEKDSFLLHNISFALVLSLSLSLLYHFICI